MGACVFHNSAAVKEELVHKLTFRQPTKIFFLREWRSKIEILCISGVLYVHSFNN